MEKMFKACMTGLMKGWVEEDPKNQTPLREKMADCCSSFTQKEGPEEGKKTMLEKMTACCGIPKEMMDSFMKSPGPGCCPPKGDSQ